VPDLSDTSFTPDDFNYMQRAIELAKKGHYTTSPNPRVGCVIVKDGKLVGEGYHKRAGSGHAEVNALAMAGEKARGATAYVTLEPCSHYGRTPPCAEALVKAGVAKVIAAMVDPNPQVSGRGIKILQQAGIDTQAGLLESDARELNPGFIQLMSAGMPYVRCKLAASLDGKTAMASGESKWITSPQARQDVQRLRAQSCAIISGADSIITDNAKMTVRWPELGSAREGYPEANLRQPIRVIIDTQNRLTPDLALFEHDSPIILIRSTIENLPSWPHFVEQVALPRVENHCGEQKLDLRALLKYLAGKGLNDVLVESGASLAGAFLEQNLVNELVLYQAPKLMGGAAKSLVTMPGIAKLSDAKALKIKDVRMLGPDIRIRAILKENN